MVQYAALNLACLHARFGHARLASCALDEAVRVAQQRHDHACVTFALGWLRYVDIREAEYEAETYGADPASRRVEAPSRHRRGWSLFRFWGRSDRVVPRRAAAAR